MTEEELEAHLNGEDTTFTSETDEHAGHDHSNMTEEELEAHLNGEDASSAEQNIIDPSEPIYADITVANYGTITVELNRDEAPITVDNFVQLAGNGFYDGLTFHRIMEGFMMQGGDPLGNGTGGSGINVTGEFSANGVDNQISHTRGTISMARSSDPDSASSQFFIVHEDSTFLDGQYAGFGYVTEGMEYVDAICADAQPTDNNGTIPADQQPVIESIVIRNS
ncbi:MAG: peptidylprolyl isomerase [Ruminococcaceae bacterium]|nr:peptidylprolyl isomerase [Oscillospiraceae bacterium]